MSSRILLVIVVACLVVPLTAFGSHLTPNCALGLVGSVNSSAAFAQSPHGVFRSGSVVYSLRGQRLVTVNVTETGELQPVRDDFISTLGAREHNGGVAFSSGFLFISGDSGLEIFDLRNTHGGAGGVAPSLVSRTAGLHYRRMAVSGNLLAGVFPARDLPCHPTPFNTCRNSIDIFNIADPSAPVLVSRILSSSSSFLAFNDVKFTNGFLWATGLGGTFAWDLTSPATPVLVRALGVQGIFLATNGTNLLAIGQETLIGVFIIGPGSLATQFVVPTLPSIVDRSNPLMFHPDAWIDDSRLITMIDEKNPMTGRSARTIAFDVFDFTVPFLEGFDDRLYENVSFTHPDEVKYNPIAVGSNVYVVGEMSGTQVWGACGFSAGRIEFDNLQGMTCGGAEIHGWVTGDQRITRVELFLDDTLLGIATITNLRTDVSSATPAFGWRVPVNLDATSRGNRVLRAVATDILGNRRQFASKTIFFNGPGQNCTARRRATKR
ncbi:MAG TPA: hypothetical protein VMT00_08650 [Thermoanaerobaculia bacterium]|nr:hypothetical protein [Thermoanaerobaculia bacterium]